MAPGRGSTQRQILDEAACLQHTAVKETRSNEQDDARSHLAKKTGNHLHESVAGSSMLCTSKAWGKTWQEGTTHIRDLGGSGAHVL